jgi:C_GCAxxG_C_C family probable redox protein
MDRALLAKEYFNEGYTCSQSIVLAFQDLMGIEKEKLIKMVLPLGGGLGRLRLTCGAVNSMAMVVGMVFSNSESNSENKDITYAIVQELAKRFKKENETLNCELLLKKAELEVEIGGKAEERTNEYYKKRPCGKIVYSAAKILEEYLIERGIL